MRHHPIRFDEPWDSEHNKQFNEYFDHATDEARRKYHADDPDHDADYGYHHNMPAVYGCPNSSFLEDHVKTVYKMVVGDNAVGNAQGTSLSQIKRPHDKTILVVESGLPVPWMSTSDFSEGDFKTATSHWHDQDKVREIREADNVNRYGLWKVVQEEGRTVHYISPTSTGKKRVESGCVRNDCV